MMRCWSRSLEYHIRPWVRDYDKLQCIAIFLIYIQIACALVGSLGALYNGVLLINLAIALFALVAIESNSQSLGRTYAGLLSGAILLDISWFILFTHDIWSISSDSYGMLFIFSVKLALAMEIIGFSVRLSSAFVWIQIYKLGVSGREADFNLRNSLLSPATPAVGRQSSDPEDILGGSIYDPAYYFSLFQESEENGYSFEGGDSCTHNARLVSAAEVHQLKISNGESFHTMDLEILADKPQNECAININKE